MSHYFPGPPSALDWPSSDGEEFDPEDDGAFSDDFGDAIDPTTAMVVFDASASGPRSSRHRSAPSNWTSAPKANAQPLRTLQPNIKGSGGSFQKWNTSSWAEAAEALLSRGGRPYTASFLRDTEHPTTERVLSDASSIGGFPRMMDRGEAGEHDDTFDSQIEFSMPEPMASPDARISTLQGTPASYLSPNSLPAFVGSIPSAKKVHFGNLHGPPMHEPPWSTQALPTNGAGLAPSDVSVPSQRGRTNSVPSQIETSKSRTKGTQEALKVTPNKHHGGRRKTRASLK